MLTPLSISPYNSRFSLDTDLLIYNDTFNYVNMTHHGFYGGTSLQSQELNELQENIQNQLSLTNTLIGNWLEYDNNINIHGEPTGGIYEVDPGDLDVFIPIDPENIIDGDTNTTNNWYLYKDNYGYEQFIRLQDENISHYDYYTRIKRRIVSGRDPNWAILRDANNNTPFDATGAHRIQLYYPFPNSVTVNPPVPRNLIDTAQYFSRIAFDGGVQDQHEWNSWGNNTIAIFSGDRITANTPIPPYSPQPRPYGDFVRNPLNPEESSPWHNLVYELAHPIYKWGNRSFLFQFPFGGFRNSFTGTVASGTETEIQNGEEGPIAGYIRLKENYPAGTQISDSKCSARWRGMKEAFSALLRGKLRPSGYPAMDEPSNIVLYLPCFMGYPTYREETCAYWDSLPGSTPDQKDAQFYEMLDQYIADLVYIKENGTEDKGTLYIGFDSLASSATPGSIELYRTIPNTEGPLVVFGYKASNPGAWSAANGGYRSDKLERADWYVRTKLEAAGIIVSGEAVPPSESTQIRIEGSTGKYHGSTIATPVLRGNTVFKNLTAVEGTMWTSRAYSAPLDNFTDILRWPSNGFEIVQALIDGPRRPGNPFNQPLQVQVQDGLLLITRECSGMNGLAFSPFYYLHTLNAVIDHIKYVDKTNAPDPNRTDIKLDQNNIIVIPTGIFASNLNEPYANDSTADIDRYYVHLGSNVEIEYRPPFIETQFINNPNLYTGGLWTDENKAYWDTNLRSLSFDAFVENIRIKSKLVSPPKDSLVSGEIVLANGFTREQTYPYDSISKGILTGIYQGPPSEQRSQIYAFSFYPIAGNVQDWTGNIPDGLPGVGGTAEVTEFSHVKPFVNIKNDYNSTTLLQQAWQPQIIRDELRMLDELNNLPNTNIKNIILNRYQSGWLYGKDEAGNNYNPIDDVNGSTAESSRSNTGHLIWPDKEIPKMQADWLSFLKLIDGDLQNLDGLRIAKTRIISDNEYIGSSNNFNIRKPYYDALVADRRYTQTKYGSPSLSSQMNGITWNGQGTAFCGDSCGFNSNYQVWNKSVEKITTAAISEALLTPFQQRYANFPHEFRATGYESNITLIGDGYPGVNGHDSYHDNIFGDSPNIHLYGRFNPGSSVWCIDSADDTKLKRITNTTTETPFTWHDSNDLDGPWNAFLTTVQGVRSVKRGLKSKGLSNTSTTAFIGTKEWEGEDPAGSSPARVGFVNTQYYDEMIRHGSLTGIEVFGFFNALTFNSAIAVPLTPANIFDRAKRREQFGVLNAILVDINNELGGYTPITLDDTRVSYNCDYVMSGAPTATGEYLWRVTPKFSTDQIFSHSVLQEKIGSQIGVWIRTPTPDKPLISIIPSSVTAAQTVTDYEVWALHWPTFPDVFSTKAHFAIDYYGPGVTGQLESGIGATFGNTFIDVDGNLQYRFKFLSVAPSMQAPPSSNGGWNGWNPPGDGYTYNSTGTDQYSWNRFKENIKKVPESKRMIQGRPWEGGNFFSASRWGWNNYYTKTADGTTYEGLRFATPWADVAATDTQISVKKFLTACKNDDLKFSYFSTDQEQAHLPWHFRKGFNSYNNGGVTAQDTPTVPDSWNTLDVKSDIRFISAIINDNRFKTKTLNDETGPTNKTLFNFYSEAFTALKTKYETLTGSSINLTVENSLLPFTGLTNADPSVIASSTFWTPYSGELSYRGRDAKSMGYEYQHIVFPSLDYMLDNIAWNNSHKKAFVDVFKGVYSTELDMFRNVKSIQYNTYEINESESPFTRDGNGMPYYTNASRGKVKNNAYTPVYYALAENSMFPTYLPVTPSTIRLNPDTGRFDPDGVTHFLDNPKYIIGITFDSYWKIRSGYIKGSTFDLEKYDFQAYLVGPTFLNQGGVLVGCSGCALPTASELVRYPETYPDTSLNTEKFYLELAFKHFTNELKHARFTHRSDPLMYEKYSPLITGFASTPTPNESLQRVYSHNKYTKLYWKEFVWQLLMHGVNFFQYWDYKYTANLGLWDLHLILDQWRTSTGNSRVRPCNSLGEVSGLFNKILDRFVLEDMYENCIISGGKILSGSMKDRYIWRISVPPKFISWNADQSFGEVVGTLIVSGSDPVEKKLAVIGDGDIRPQSDFVLRSFGRSCPSGVPCPADFDEDGFVSATDISIFQNYESENRLGFTVINPPGIKTAPTFAPNNPP
jgi:hypothetical protein